MCDAFSVIGAGVSIATGNIEAKGIMANAKFEAAQLQLASFMVAAKSNQGETQVLKSYAEQAEANLAAAAISGISNQSFASIEKGNQEDSNMNIGKLRSAGRWESMNLDSEAKLTKVMGVHEARSARLKGWMGAFNTLKGAEDSYQEYNSSANNGSRTGSFLRSVGYKG